MSSRLLSIGFLPPSSFSPYPLQAVHFRQLHFSNTAPNQDTAVLGASGRAEQTKWRGGEVLVEVEEATAGALDRQPVHERLEPYAPATNAFESASFLRKLR
jgi:hypothetical protein